MSDTKPRRKLAAILAADVVNFSMMMGDNEDRTLISLKACRAFTDEFITSNHGRFYMGLEDYQMAYQLIEEAVAELPDAGSYRGFKASVMGYLDKGDEAKAALDYYLKLRPNLKTKDDYKKIFALNSLLADILIEGLVKAGWEPEGG
jgi:tetratricopeptide (TPR) repeat protein